MLQMVHEHNATGVGSSKFGMSRHDVMKIVEQIKAEPEVKLMGLHCHIGSTIEDVSMFRWMIQNNDVTICTLPIRFNMTRPIFSK